MTMTIPELRKRIRFMRSVGLDIQSVKFHADGSITMSSAQLAQDEETSFDKFLEESG